MSSLDKQSSVASWGALAAADAELAGFGQERLDGKVAYLATIRSDGRPRAHPVTPIIGKGHLFLFMEPSSPKSKDLLEQGDYCLHCAMSDSSGSSGEFLITGTARHLVDPALREVAESVSNFRPSVRYQLFELDVSEALATWYMGGRPVRRRWQCSRAAAEVS